jgi:hypothetical protein
MPFLTTAKPAASKPSPHAYRAFLEEIRRGGNYFPKPRALVRAIGSRASDVLMHLVNVGQASADSEGWILATPKFLLDGLGLTQEQQDAALSKLENLGAVGIAFAGTTRQRVRVNLERARELAAGKL